MSELSKLLEHCLKCSLCQSACPVTAYNPDYPGPKVLGPDLARLKGAGGAKGVPGVLPSTRRLIKLLDMCSGCQRCDVACPYGVPVAQLIRRNRGLPAGKHFLRDKMLACPQLLGRPGTALSALTNTALKSAVLQKIMRGMLGLDMEQPVFFAAKKDLLRPTLGRPAEPADPAGRVQTLECAQPAGPSMSGESVRLSTPAEPAGLPVPEEDVALTAEKKIIYFPGCHVNYYEPEVGNSFLRFLELLGVKASVSQQICCGMPLLAAGNLEQARSSFQNNVSFFKDYVEKGYAIVTTCPTCSLALKKIYVEELVSGDARQLAGAVYDFAEYLEQYSSRLAAIVHPVQEDAVYHLPCHTQAQGTGMSGINLMRLIPGLEMRIVEGCCGQSGTYGFKAEHKEVSMAIGRPLVRQITALNPKVIITPCGSCKGRISFETGVRVLHPVQILNAASVLFPFVRQGLYPAHAHT